jgi:hypothetical protein
MAYRFFELRNGNELFDLKKDRVVHTFTSDPSEAEWHYVADNIRPTNTVVHKYPAKKCGCIEDGNQYRVFNRETSTIIHTFDKKPSKAEFRAKVDELVS